MVDPASKYTPVDYWVISVTDKGTTKPETWDVVRSLVHAQADMWALTGLIPINATPAIVARLTGDTVRTDVGDMVPVNMNPRGQKEEEQEQLLVTAYEEIAADPRVLTDIVAKVKGSLDRL